MNNKLKPIIKQYKGFYNYTWRLCNDKHLAKDILQDAFIKAFKSINNIKDNHTSIEAWFKTVIKTVYLNNNRTESRKATYRTKEIDQHELINYYTVNMGYKNLIEQDHYKVLQAKSKNKFEYKILDLLYQGYKNKDISDVLKIDRQVINKRINIIRHK